MLKKINGRKYNPDSAHLVGTLVLSGTSPARDYDYLAVSLYRKRTGEYFLLYDGGARTPYFSPKIEPVSVDDAREWARQYLEPPVFRSEFSPAVCDERVVTSFSLRSDTLIRLRQLAHAADCTMGQYIDRLVADKILHQ